ncbi:MFS transporter, AAHS family, benzoate transport protein/MFS transporter, AAHS family, 4-hydroxybenzoate transporter [Variovorax sp. PDC80]|uniref:MFS transporter n=1 Tax=Variovorax sp. PDC80 TaxID=1882827 RepID=UPI0008E7900E|nr:MFS transporter [Variovorax sp. PDC80]SFO91376.1 MFS transporter, AAHS family, benzoate transport protein/MFS transporter, AAHS family, 4-hydroxybenzoate transporter [Variovorax sp. PDC80]
MNDKTDLGGLLDASPVRRGHVLTVATLFLVLLIDGYDLAVTGQMLPAIASALGVPTASLTGAFALQPMGQAIGGLLLSPLADHFGRKRMLIALLALFSVATLQSVFATSVFGFGATRFIAGMLGGGLLPAAASLVADISSVKRRSTMVGIVYAGVAIGAVGASGLVALALDRIGWQGMYLIGALAPLLMILPIVLWMPESPLHLARTGAPPSDILKALRKLGIVVDASARLRGPARRTGARISLFEIFGDRRALFTAALWFSCICGQIAVNLFGIGAVFFHEFGRVPVASFAAYASMAGLASIVAGLSTGFVIDRFGRYPVTAVYALLGALSLAGLGLFPFGTAGFVAVIVSAGFFVVGTYQSLNIITPIVYPAALRSAAVGWKGAVSRFGSSAAPLIAAALLAQQMGVKVAMCAAAAPLLIVVLLAPVLAVLERRMRSDHSL